MSKNVQTIQQGFNQSTPAQVHYFGKVFSRGAPRARASAPARARASAPARRAAAAPARSRSAAPARKAAARSKPARLVKGSAAAKAYMAKIRRKRR
jgi:hypothetical protein